MKSKHGAALVMAVWTIVAVNGLAAEGHDDGWQNGIALPLWAAGINGNVTVKGIKQDVDVSFDDLKDHLDAAFGLEFTARKDKLCIYTGFGYLKLSGAGGGGGNGGVSDDLKFLIADAGVSYQLVKTGEEHPFTLEATAGIRYWWAKNELKFKGPGGVVAFDGSASKDLVDPVIGLRGSKFFTRKLHLDFAGDIGGFGISDTQANLDWSATGLVSYDFTKWFTLSGGYKALALDYSTGSGSNKNGLDLIINGVLFTANFKF